MDGLFKEVQSNQCLSSALAIHLKLVTQSLSSHWKELKELKKHIPNDDRTKLKCRNWGNDSF